MIARELHQDGMHILALEGDIDLSCSPELREMLHAHADEKHPVLVLDFTGVSYVDSSGLATLVEYVRLAQSFGGHFGLACVSERVRTILDLVRLSEIFPIYPTLADARAAVAASSPGA